MAEEKKPKPTIDDLQVVVCTIHSLQEIADKLDPKREKPFEVVPLDNAVHNLNEFFLRHTNTLPYSLGCPSKEKLIEFLKERKSKFIEK